MPSTKIRNIAQNIKTQDVIMILVIILLLIGPYIYFTVIGARALENGARQTKCSDTTGAPTLATWLLVYGSVNLGPYILALGLVISILISIAVVPMIAATMLLIWGLIIVMLCIFFFNIAWVTVGILQLSKDGAADKCEAEEPVVYYSTIAAIVFWGLSIIVPIVAPFNLQFNMNVTS